MRHIIVAVALLSASALPAFAQTKPATSSDGATPAITTPDSKNATAPVAGANSFTETQAKERMEKAGYSNVMGLKKAEDGVWMASGTKDGQVVAIALDYQGNVVTK
ncbi:PepSY domain-containing protein [Rhizobium sp.]|jgi:hypothetical protein|uniref:PepSY domain-containing protein n=1 Tax=Rhizobium sp. TaxID=391 RepID=UPI000E85CAF0|nr:hypothetical protein [Rhizobium sp.]